MKPVLTVAEMRAVDEQAQASTPLTQLVARAGSAVAGEAVAMLASRGGPYGARVLIVAGKGHNGDDGRVAARLLARRGAGVTVAAPGSPPAQRPGEQLDLVVDAAYGTGFRGDYEAPQVAAPVLAVDVPTGLNADTGLAGARSVRADRTVTFGALKPGLLLNDGPLRTGIVVVRRIGLPVPDSATRILLVTDDDVAAELPGRGLHDHKWMTAVMVVAGSPGMLGAARYASLAAARAGAGMVRLGVPGARLDRLPAGAAVAVPLGEAGDEAWDGLALEASARCKALVVGPGLGLGPGALGSVPRLVSAATVPTVVDADGLSCLGRAGSAAAIIGRRRRPDVVLTPHDAEFARMAGSAPGDDRIGAVRALAAEVGCVVLLKGATTVVADQGGKVLLVTSGSSNLATAGSGDVLSGIIGAFLARGLPALTAAALGAQVLGLASDLGHCEGLLAEDLPLLVADALSGLAATRSADQVRVPGTRDG
ncbi:MAG: NAD(P)H-hydrate dehydratase [Acidimicrobiales bacterium]